MCLKKENILGVEILQDQYETIIQSLVIWVFEIGIVKSLLKIDAKIFFDVIYLFFVKQAVEIVNKYSEKIKIRYPPSLEEQEIELISFFLIYLNIFNKFK